MTKRPNIAKFRPYHERSDSRPLHVQLGIATCVYRMPVLAALAHDNNAFYPINRVGPNNHLFRASITLARI